MDLSALIFVALAVAWAAYLVPKALKHHEEVHRSRSVERFSHTMRVLARREPVSRRAARLVVTPMRRASRPAVETKASASAAVSAAVSVPAIPRERGRRSAAQRRRRVLGVLVLAAVVVGALAGFAYIHWGWVAVPASLLVGWLVACRLMVRRERERRTARPAAPVERTAAPAEESVAGPEAVEHADHAEQAGHAEQVAAAEPAPGTWQMVPMTLPTYVDKPAAARRTVQTIDLESTGVWSSGRNESDSALAREAEAAERSAREQASARRASGA